MDSKSDPGSLMSDWTIATYDEDLNVIEDALRAPESMEWSSTKIHYSNAAGVVIKSLKKKLGISTGQQWLLVEDIDHEGLSRSQPEQLRRGDHIQKINECEISLGIGRQKIIAMVKELSGKPVDFEIKRPMRRASKSNARSPFECDLQMGPVRPLVGPSSMTSSSAQVFNAVRDTPSASITSYRPEMFSSYNSNDLYPQPQSNMTLAEPTDLERQSSCSSDEILQSLVHSDIHLKRLERLSHYRLIVHDCRNVTSDIKKKFLKDFFEMSHLPNYPKWVSVGQMHLHLAFKDNSYCISDPTEEDEMGPCIFELKESYETMCRYSYQSPSKGSMNLPTSMSQSDLQLHLDVFIPEHFTLTRWYSPVLYCKHSINVIVIEWGTDLSLLLQLLQEIVAHSGEYHETGENKPRILLVFTNTHSAANINPHLNKYFKPFLSFLITHKNHKFAVCNGNQESMRPIKDTLFRQLKSNVKEEAVAHNYYHLSVLLWQKLRKMHGIIERRTINELLESLSENGGGCYDSKVTENVYQYLHNSGLVYVPENGFSTQIRKGCSEVRHSLLIHPHQLLTTVNPLLNAEHENVDKRALINFHETGQIKEILLHKLVENSYSEKIVGILKDYHIAIPVPRQDGLLIVPFVTWESSMTRRLSNDMIEGMPELVLSYNIPPPFMMVVCLLNELESLAYSSRVDYHRCTGRYDLYDFNFEIRLLNPFDESPLTGTLEPFIGFYFKEEGRSRYDYAKNMVAFLEKFHKGSEIQYQFGPICPLQDCTLKQIQMHVLDLRNAPANFSCSGLRIEGKTNQYIQPEFKQSLTQTRPHPGTDSPRLKQLRLTVNYIPPYVLRALDRIGPDSQYDWRDIARGFDMTEEQIVLLEALPEPSIAVMKYAGTKLCKSINDLFDLLRTTDRVDVITEIGSWLDSFS